MSRIYGFVAGTVVALSAVYGTVSLTTNNTKLITRELKRADDIARDRPKVIRPYTDPINLETRNWRDTVVDVWNREIIRSVQYLNSLIAK